MPGYIKIDRKILEWEWYRNINTKILFLHCLLKANWKEGKFEGRAIPKGSFVTSIPRLSEETMLTTQEVRTALAHLKSTGEITVETTNKYSVITINNYSSYQDTSSPIDSQATDSQQFDNRLITGSQQPINSLSTTIEEGKNIGKGEGKKGKRKEDKKEGISVPKKKEPITYYPNDEKLNQAFCDYVDMRKKIKAPMTDNAIRLAMNNLQKLSGGDNEMAIEILEQSIMNSWKGLFEIKGRTICQSKSVFDEWRNA